MKFDRISLGKQAKEQGFVRDTFEKTCRLVDVLSFMGSDALLSDALALKGGTAINLTIFNLPRLSVDIDMDYTKDVSREIMLSEREQITEHLKKYMIASGYRLSPKSRQYHALDSFVYEYINVGGVKDNLKIEINYMLRCHVFPVCRRGLYWNNDNITILSVDPIEIFSAKAVALMNRSAPRDLYDMFNLQRYGIFDESQKATLKKCIMFYMTIASDNVPDHFDFSGIDKITAHKIKTDLTPVLSRDEHFDLVVARTKVEEYLKNILMPLEHTVFWTAFAKGKYKPELLFDEPEILSRILKHPMALWKCKGIKNLR